MEGIALLRAFSGAYDREFTLARFREIRELLESPDSFGAGIEARPISTRDGYDGWAPSYDEQLNQLLEIEQPFVREIVDGLPIGVALDAACGTGRHALYLASLGHTVIGVDSSPGMLARAREKVPQGEFHEADLDELPLADDSVDLVVCAIALVHLADIDSPFREFARVLRPGGHLVVSDQRGLIGDIIVPVVFDGPARASSDTSRRTHTSRATTSPPHSRSDSRCSGARSRASRGRFWTTRAGRSMAASGCHRRTPTNRRISGACTPRRSTRRTRPGAESPRRSSGTFSSGGFMSEYSVTQLDEIEEMNDGREPWRPVRHQLRHHGFRRQCVDGPQRGRPHDQRARSRGRTDPDRRQLATAYLGLVPRDTETRSVPGDTAWHAVEHGCPSSRSTIASIVLAGRDRLRAKLSYTNAGFALAPESFTLSELRSLYAAALGHDVSTTNLQRVLLRRGLLEETGERRLPGRAGGRPASVYRFRSRTLEVTDPFAVLRPPG